MLLTTAAENSAMAKRGPYKKGGSRPAPPAWKRTFLAEWRDLRGYTQEELAERAGVSVGLISSMEAATSGYSAESLHKLAAALNVEPGMILSVNPKGAEPLWSIVSRATEDQRDQIAKHASVIVPPKKGAAR